MEHRAIYFEVSMLPSERVVKVVRTSVPFPETNDLGPMFANAHAAVDAVERASFGLLLDLRQSVGRNDETFEKLIAPQRKRLEQGFARVAVLVRSMVGKLQIERHARDDGVNLRVFHDEDEALRWAAGREL